MGTTASSHSAASALASPTDAYNRWKRRTFLACCILVGFVLVMVAGFYYRIHLTHHYNEVFAEATRNQSRGADIWSTSGCATKPPGFKSDMLDCEKADRYRSLDPHYVAMVETLDHFFFDDLSPWSWINQCHYGVCRGFIWHLSEQIIVNFQLVLWAWIALALVLVSTSGGVLYKCCGARREKQRADAVLANEPQTQARQMLREALRADLVEPTVDGAQAHLALVNRAVEQFQQRMAQKEHVALPIDPLLPPPRYRPATMPATSSSGKWLTFQRALGEDYNNNGEKFKTV